MTGTIQQAAAEITRLINSRPTSPSESELAALIGRFGTNAPAAMSPAHAELYRKWRGLIETHIREFGGGVEPPLGETVEALEERMGAHMEVVEALGERIFATPVRAWGDIVAYAEVCFWYHWAGVDAQGPNAERQMQGAPFSGGKPCDEALAKVLSAIFALARPATARVAAEATS